jgi:hypothetical protein
VNSEYFWWLAALALVAAGGIVALQSWQPASDDGQDDAWDAEGDDITGWPDGASDAWPA